MARYDSCHIFYAFFITYGIYAKSALFNIINYERRIYEK